LVERVPTWVISSEAVRPRGVSRFTPRKRCETKRPNEGLKPSFVSAPPFH
jgi:hypothetical protein